MHEFSRQSIRIRDIYLPVLENKNKIKMENNKNIIERLNNMLLHEHDVYYYAISFSYTFHSK